MLFKHYKGGLYKVLHHTANMDAEDKGIVTMVVYQALDTGLIWVRPHAEFFGHVTINGEQRNRFKPLTTKQIKEIEEQCMKPVGKIANPSPFT